MNSNKLIFKIFEKYEINESAEFLANIFLKYDPFISKLNLNPIIFKKCIENDLIIAADEKLSVIVKDEENKIKGFYGAYRLETKRKLFKTLTEGNSELKFHGERFKNMTDFEKLQILETIDQVLLSKSEAYSKSQEGDIYCDYYCISDKYFKSSLSKDLPKFYFKFAIDKGVKRMYGTFYNKKSIQVFIKHFEFEKLSEIKVELEEENFDFMMFMKNTYMF